MKRQMKSVTIKVLSDYGGRSTRDGFIKWMDDALAALPEGAQNPQFELEKHEEWYPYEEYANVSARLNLHYTRPETDEEFDARITEHNSRILAQEEREKAEFKRLSEKFNK